MYWINFGFFILVVGYKVDKDISVISGIDRQIYGHCYIHIPNIPLNNQLDGCMIFSSYAHLAWSVFEKYIKFSYLNFYFHFVTSNSVKAIPVISSSTSLDNISQQRQTMCYINLQKGSKKFKWCQCTQHTKLGQDQSSRPRGPGLCVLEIWVQWPSHPPSPPKLSSIHT